jgi:4-diphosphocytidyl-2-C-methyl-D-erythritol kinase
VLRVGPLGPDGYHPLRTLLVALDGLADTVSVAPSASRRVTCPGIEGADNLAWRALDELEAECGRPLPCEVVIEKRIPARAGLGGGSSDAAATLLGADRAYGLGLEAARLEGVAARVGSDVPFFVRGGAQWAEGRGERLAPASVPRFAAVLARPGAGLSTAEVYRAFDRLPTSPRDAAPDLVARSGNRSPYRELVARACNDLWPAALALAPGLGATARALAAAGADAALLCGSGSCLAGLFPTRSHAEAAARRLRLPGFRAVVEGGGSPARPPSPGTGGSPGRRR